MAASLREERRTKGTLYRAWYNMKRRCNNQTKDSHRYIERGITYSLAWETFDGFYADMAFTHKNGLTLDRIDNDKGYDVENCRWATAKQQQNNKGNNRLFTINGITKTLSQWCESVEVKPSTVKQRFYVYKWPIERALFS